MFDFHISVGVIISICTIVVGFIVQWVTLKGRSEANAAKIASHTNEIDNLKHSVASMKLTMATDFAPKTMITEVETRILERMTEQHRQLGDNINRLTEEFREVRKVLMER